MLRSDKNIHTGKIINARLAKQKMSNYLSRDILTAICREKTYEADELVYVTDKSQKDHFDGVFSCLDALGHRELAEKCRHIGFGKILGVSTRGGTGAGLGDVVEQAISYQHNQAQLHKETTYKKHNFSEISDDIRRYHAAWSVSSMVLNAKREKDIKWKWENFSASKGDSGWYLQKSYSKVSNLISRNSQGSIVPISAYENKDFENFIETNVWTKLMIEMTKYEKIRTQSLDQLESIHLLRFATGLSQCLMRIIQSDVRIKDLENRREIDARLAILDEARKMLRDVLNLLGYEPTEQF